MSERFRLSVGVVLRPEYEHSVASNTELTATQRFLHVCDGNDTIESLAKSLNGSFNRALGKNVAGSRNMLVTSESYVIDSAYSVRDVFDVKDKLFWVVDQVLPLGSVSSSNGKHQPKTQAPVLVADTPSLPSSSGSSVLSGSGSSQKEADSTPAMESAPLASFARDRALENKAEKQPDTVKQPAPSAASKKNQKDSSIANNVGTQKTQSKKKAPDSKPLGKKITGHQDFSALEEIAGFESAQDAEMPIRDFVIKFWKRDGLVASKSVLIREIQELKEKWSGAKVNSTSHNDMITRLFDIFPEVLDRDKKKRMTKAAKFKEAKEAKEAKAKEAREKQAKEKEAKQKEAQAKEAQDKEVNSNEAEESSRPNTTDSEPAPSARAVVPPSEPQEPNTSVKANISTAVPKTPSGFKPTAESTPAVHLNNDSDSDQSHVAVAGKKRPLRRKINRVVELEAETPIVDRNADNSIRFGTAPDSDSDDSDGGPIRKRRAVAPPRSATPDESTLRAPPTPTPAKVPVETPVKKATSTPSKPPPGQPRPAKPRHSIGLRSLSSLETIDTDVYEGRSMSMSNPNVTPKIPDPPESSDEESLSESSGDSSSDSSSSDSGDDTIPHKRIAGKREKEKRNRSGFSGLLSDSSKLR